MPLHIILVPIGSILLGMVIVIFLSFWPTLGGSKIFNSPN